jgi:hypothetical protein
MKMHIRIYNAFAILPCGIAKFSNGRFQTKSGECMKFRNQFPFGK